MRAASDRKRRADGRWEARFTAEVDGARKRRSLFGRTKAEAAQRLRAAVTARDTASAGSSRSVRRLNVFEFRFWSGARDLNPGPHGPESHDKSSKDAGFGVFQFDSSSRRALPSRSRRNTSEMKEAFDESPTEERCPAAVLGRDSRRRQRGGRGRGTRQQQEDEAALQQEGRISVVQTGWRRGFLLTSLHSPAVGSCHLPSERRSTPALSVVIRSG